jgi:two-component system, NarL family, nitrate/nitrite response regulator NarL
VGFRPRPSRQLTRVFVISRVCLYRDGLATMLVRRRQIDVVGTAANVADAARACHEARVWPDVVLLDTAGGDVGEAVEALRAALPGSRLVALTVPSREQELLAYVEAGVDGFVTVEASFSELVAAITSAARGEALCSPTVAAALIRRLAARARELAAPEPAVALTAREREIAELIGGGLSNKQIARRLCIELPTVKNHVHHILAKLGVRGRHEAAALVRAGRT